MKVKYKIKDYFPQGTMITGTWGTDVRTIYKNKIEDGEWLRWSEIPGSEDMTHSWRLRNLIAVEMDNEAKMET